MTIRLAVPTDHNALLNIWLRAVRATHTFLTEPEIAALIPAVHDYLSSSTTILWVLCGDNSEPIGFMGLAADNVESLFIAPESLRRGAGRMLLEHARRLKGRLRVDVNEQNPEAVKFYEANGFRVIGRSAVDDAGRPYPLLHMREEAEYYSSPSH